MTFIFKRFASSLPTLFGASLLAFFIVRWAPGDPVLLMLGERGADPQVYNSLKAELGLDQSLSVQYLKFVGRALHGDFGVSLVSRKPVLEEFFSRFPATVELSLVSLGIAVLLGVPMGLAMAFWRKTLGDYALRIATLVGYSLPIFWWGLILILIFSVQFGLTPVSGRMDASYDVELKTGFLLIDSWLSSGGMKAFASALTHIFLPSLTLATVPLAAIARISRSAALDVSREDYIRTAKAKGLSLRAIWIKHVLFNALIPIVTVIGLMLGTLLTGAVLTESLFAWPGIGNWLVTSITARDYPVIQGSLIIICVIIMALNFLIDLIYMVLNPQVRDSQ